MSRLIFVAACFVAVSVSAQSAWSPARYRSGTVPALPALAVGGGDVMLEVEVAADGSVVSATPLRSTPPFTDAVVKAVRGWKFQPAEDVAPSNPERKGKPPLVPVASKVLVAAVFRAPVLLGPTQGQGAADVAAAAAEIALPLNTTIPLHPPNALSSGVVLLEVKVDAAGAVTGARPLRSAPPFDDPARKAVQQWRFRPARLRGTAVATNVYVIFGFPQPVTTGPAAR